MTALMQWSGILVGLVGVLYAAAVVMASREEAEHPPDDEGAPEGASLVPLMWSAIPPVAVGILAIVGGKPPFAPGGALGSGLLIGALFGAASAWAMELWPSRVPGELSESRMWVLRSAICSGLCAWTVTGATLPLLIFKASPSVALMGYAVGFATVALLLGCAPLAGVMRGRWTMMGPQALLATTLAAAGCLAVRHFPDDPIWWALPFGLAGLTILAGIISSRVGASGEGRSQKARMAFSAAAGALIVAAVWAVLAAGTVGSWAMFACVATGLVATGLILALTGSARAQQSSSSSLQTAAFAGIITLGGVVVCFRLLAGYGVAVGLAASWVVLLPAIGGLIRRPGDDSAPWREPGMDLMPFLSGWAIFALYRLFLEHYHVGPVEPSVHYSFVAVGVGALAMLLFGGYATGGTDSESQQAPSGGWLDKVRPALLAMVAVVLPLLVAVLWGHRAAAGLVGGLFIGALALAALQVGAELQRPVALSAYVAGLLAALVAVQFTRLLEPLLGASRGVRLLLVLAGLVIALAWIIVDAALAPRRGEEVAQR